MLFRLPACLLLLVLSAFASGRKPVTIDDVVDGHRPESIHPIWAPDGKSFAYQKDGSVYRFTIADRKPSVWFKISSLEQSVGGAAHDGTNSWPNRRVSEAQFQWFPSGNELLAAVQKNLFIVHADGSATAISLSEQTVPEDPKLSPDGSKILLRSGPNLFVYDLRSKATTQLTADGSPTLLNGQLDWVYPEELDLGTASWWSPDSKRIAYLQFDISCEFTYPQVDLLHLRAVSEPERYPQAGTPNANVRVGVVPVSGGTTTWMMASGPDNLVARVAWLPDSSKLAIETAPRTQKAIDFVFYDPSSGTKQPVIHEESKTWLNITDNFKFLQHAPEFIWTSERSGFRHLYRYSNKGELLGQLTSGDWEVNGLTAVDETQKLVLYTGSEDSPLETQLYSVPLNGGERKRLTKANLDHAIAANEEGSYYLDRSSTLSEPYSTTLRSRAGEYHVPVIPVYKKEEKEFELQPAEIVKVPASDGTVLFAKLIKPVGFRSGVKYPAIVEVYGGPGAQSVRNSWRGADMAQVYAVYGYVVWQLDNRGSFGRGHAFEAPIYHELGRQEVMDQVAGVRHLIQMGFVDPKRVGVTGWSYGGYMTIHCLLFAADTFRAGVAGAPVTDWHNYDTIYTERYMGLPSENEKGYRESSNVLKAGKLEGKLLIEHNIEDDNVLFQNTVQMVDALEKAQKQYVMQVYPEKTHGVTGPVQKTLLQATLDFFNGNLR